MRLANQWLIAASLLFSVWASPTLAADNVKLPEIGSIKSVSEVVKHGLAEDAKCTRCHDESENKPILNLYQTKHGVRADGRAPSCTSCHGQSEAHLKDKKTQPDVVFNKTSSGHHSDPAVQSETCLTCHKSGARAHWEGSQHQGQNIPCATCHTVHAKSDPVMVKKTQQEVCFTCHKEQRSQSHRVSTHPLDAGKMACTDCHNPHGATGPKLLVKNTLNETCYTCHAEKRGPLLWEHSPVTDDCGNCHTPHGSTNTPLLKARPPYLCQQCHTNEHASSLRMTGSTMTNGAVTSNLGQQQPGGVGVSIFNTGRACLNCHVQIHGSNHPAGSKFNR